MGDVTNAQSWFEATAFVEAVNPRILPTALKQDMVAAARPRLRKRGRNDSTAVTPALKCRVGNYVFKECVTTPAPQQVRRGDQHRCGNDPAIRFSDEDAYPLVREHLTPDVLRARKRLHGQTDFGCPEEIQQWRQI